MKCDLINLLKIRNSGKGGKYKFTWGGKDKICESITDISNKLFEMSGQFQAKDWYNDFVADVKQDPEFKSSNDFETVWLAHMTKYLNETLNMKRDKRDLNQMASMPSAFNAEFQASSLKPKVLFNKEDLDLLKGLVYCKKNSAIYYCDEFGNYTFLGSPGSYSDVKSETSRETSLLICKRIAKELGINEFDIWSWMWEQCNKMTEEWFRVRSEIEDGKSQGKIPSAITVKWLDKDYTVKDLFEWYEDDWSNDFIDDLHSKAVSALINDMLPSSMFRNNLICLRYETKDGLFKRYNLAPAKNIAMCSFADYLKAVFAHPQILEKLPSFNNQPYVIQDDYKKISTYKLIPNWKETLAPNQFKEYKECKILSSFLEPYTQDEKIFIMAWAYSVLHPSTSEGIGLMIKTGGGAFKTNGYSNMIALLLEKMYGADKDELTLLLKRDSWVKQDQYLEPDGNKGLSKCALFVSDECTESCIERYKDWSGSTSNVGVDYAYKKVYQVPVNMKIFCRWLFLTNKQIVINDTDGVFERRLAIIDRMDIKQLKKPYSQKEYPQYVERELEVFYNLAKDAYTQLTKKYTDLVEAANSLSFSKNLKQAYKEDDKLFIYYKLTKDLVGDEKATYNVKQFNMDVESFCKDLDVNVNGFKNWIKDSGDKFVHECRWNYPKKENGEVHKCHDLYRLKDEYMPVIEE